jgi:hypothetical protein
MRLYYDCDDENGRQRLASTIFLFLLVANGAILALALMGAKPLARHLFGSARHVVPLVLVLSNTFINGFFFIPFHLLRIEGRSVQFSALTFTRAACTVVLRVLLIAVVHLGVLGFILSDTIVAIVFVVVLLPWFARLVRPIFSRQVLREALRFGLPRVPHGLAQQVIGPGTDGYLLRLFLPGPRALASIGVYGIGATFGLTLKLFLSAFEYAWAPFYFGTMGESNAKEIFSRVATYGVAVLVLLASGLAAISYDLVATMTRPEFRYAARVVGVGDVGGAPDAASVDWVEKAIGSKQGVVSIRNTAADQLSRDLTDAERAALPQYEGELLLKTHGVGCYTSQAAMKTWNRRNELLADAAERASVAAEWLGGPRYPRERLRTAWIRETVPAKRKELLDSFQVRAFEAVPYAYFGQYSPAYAARKTLKNLDQYWGIPTLWALDK